MVIVMTKTFSGPGVA